MLCTITNEIRVQITLSNVPSSNKKLMSLMLNPQALTHLSNSTLALTVLSLAGATMATSSAKHNSYDRFPSLFQVPVIQLW